MNDWVTIAEEKLGVKLSVNNRDGARAADGPCPVCGGVDRFLVYRESGYAFCTRCDYHTWWKKKEKNFAEKAREDFEENRNKKIFYLRKYVDWEKYCKTLFEPLFNDFLEDLVKNRGINTETIKKFGIGLIDDFVIKRKDKKNEHLGTAYTIPVFVNNQFVDVRYNILYPPQKGMKYRSHYAGFIPFPFNMDCIPNTGTIIVLEGEFKTIVFNQYFPDIPSIGVLGKNLLRYAIRDLDNYNKIKGRSFIIAFDPDAENEANVFAKKLLDHGANTVKIAYFPEKPDDFLIRWGEESTEIVLKQSIVFNK